MKLGVRRVALNDDYTIGHMSVNGVYECDTLEDKVRDLNRDGDLDDAGEGKVFGKTAIPYGIYNVVITYSNRFNRDLPLIENVKGFDGIRIHPGNTAEDTHGCILVGKNTIKGKVTQSRETFDILYTKIKNAIESGETVTIEII